MNILDKSFWIGFFGDLLLQIITIFRGDFAGLKNYFEIHGIFESLLIASGIMYVSTWLFLKTGLKMTFFNLFIFGGLLDVLWRVLNLMPSLKTYYMSLNPLVSFIWGGIPMMLLKIF